MRGFVKDVTNSVTSYNNAQLILIINLHNGQFESVIMNLVLNN